jgi:hypothetical protein
MAEESMLLVSGLVVSAPVMPGFLLCVPGLLLFIVPVVAIGLLAAAAGLMILLAAAPVLVGGRAARRLRHGLAARRVHRVLTAPGGPVRQAQVRTGSAANAGTASSPLPLAQITSRPHDAIEAFER